TSAYAAPRNDYGAISVAAAINHVDRLSVIVGRTLTELTTLDHWGLLWYLFGAGLLSLVWSGPVLRTRAYVALSAVVPFAVLDLAYVFSVWNPYTMHID